MKFNENMLLLYGVTDRTWTGRLSLIEQIEEALKGGVTILQLREKQLPEEDFTREAIQVCRLCHSYNVPLIINDNLQVALRSGADGVHVGIEDTPVAEIRRIAPEDFIIGATCKTPRQAKLAEAAGADYMGVGAVFPSPTKEAAVRITTRELRSIVDCVSIPAVAIGGITAENITEIRGSGVSGAAVCSAIFGAEDICRETALLKNHAKAVVEG